MKSTKTALNYNLLILMKRSVIVHSADQAIKLLLMSSNRNKNQFILPGLKNRTKVN